MLGVYLAFGLVSCSLLQLDYSVVEGVWNSYGEPVEVGLSGGSNELSGDLVGKISEDPLYLAETMWPLIMETKASILRFRVKVDDTMESFSSIDLVGWFVVRKMEFCSECCRFRARFG